MMAQGHMVQTSAKLATARRAVKTANDIRFGTTQMSVDKNAHTSVIVVTSIALIARRYAHHMRASRDRLHGAGAIHTWFHASRSTKRSSHPIPRMT